MRGVMLVFTVAAGFFGVAAHLYVRDGEPPEVKIDVTHSAHADPTAGKAVNVSVAFVNRGTHPVRLLGIAVT